MPLSKEEFAAQLDRAAFSMQGLPVTSALLGYLRDSLKKGEPAWWGPVSKAWADRSFVAWTEAWSLLLTAVHYDALSDAQCPLTAYFPSCGGSDEVDPTTVFAKYMADPPKRMLERLKAGHRRAYVARRAPLWVLPAVAYFQRRGLPYYLVQLNAGAGLELASDMIYSPSAFDPELVAARIGLDPAPLDLEDLDHRRWLTAAMMPEEGPAILELDRVMEAVSKRQRHEPNFIQLAPCPTDKMPGFLTKNIPADDEEVGLFVISMGTTVRMTDLAYASFRKAMGAALKPWDKRGLWLEVESARAEKFSTAFQALLHKPDGSGDFEDHVMMRIDLEANKAVVDRPKVEKFLEVKAAKK